MLNIKQIRKIAKLVLLVDIINNKIDIYNKLIFICQIFKNNKINIF